MRTTKVANRDIPIEEGELLSIRFSGGRGGKSEAGLIVIKCTARCHHGSDPGERFRRMEGERGYEDCWEVASTAKAVRPARPKEVTDWLNGHREDTAFAESCLVGDKMVKLVETADGFRFE